MAFDRATPWLVGHKVLFPGSSVLARERTSVRPPRFVRLQEESCGRRLASRRGLRAVRDWNGCFRWEPAHGSRQFERYALTIPVNAGFERKEGRRVRGPSARNCRAKVSVP